VNQFANAVHSLELNDNVSEGLKFLEKVNRYER